MQFTEANISKLFGNEAAEQEPVDRLKEYYFKNNIYDQVICDAPLRILVGHKGIGKSALVKIGMDEDEHNGYLSILIRPDDVVGIASDNKNLLELIRDWKLGLNSIISCKILDSLGYEGNSNIDVAKSVSGKFISFVAETITAYKDKINLTPAKEMLIDKFLKNRRLVIYIDDLDRGWEGKPLDIKRISALLNAVRDMSSDNSGLFFRIALRSDVYFLVRTSDESTDKIESSVIWYSWSNHEILVLLAKRIETFFGHLTNEQQLLSLSQGEISKKLNGVFEPKFTGQGLWENAPIYRVLMSLIRKRPRDLVKLCIASARQAYLDKSETINTKHLKAVFEDYSQGRIQDTINEYRTELVDIERLLMGMKPNKKTKIAKQSYFFSTDQLLQKIDSIIQSGKFKFANNKDADKKDLAQFLYKINFITARKELTSDLIQRKYFEENRYISSKFADFGYDWEIHPAYRWALQPDNIDDLFSTLHLSSDD